MACWLEKPFESGGGGVRLDFKQNLRPNDKISQAIETLKLHKF